MKTAYRRPSSSLIPGYSSNAVIQLIIASGVGFAAFFFTVVCFQAFGPYKYEDAWLKVITPIALPDIAHYGSHWWTIFTYGWAHNGFWEWLSNMIWLYCFGSVVQSLVGHKQIIPLFVGSLLVGGIFYLLAQKIPGGTFRGHAFLIGAQAGLMGLAAAAVTLAPKYRVYIGPSLGIPLLLIAAIFLFLMLLNVMAAPAMICLLLGGALFGSFYIMLLRKGYKPGEFVYDSIERMERFFTPDEQKAIEKHNKKRSQVLSRMYEPKQGISQRRIDELLDKILQHGYNSLTREEKETLLRASKENDQ
ncbi:rhomboid family intramembrane serine protease [Chitinophagaceae bacterium MMS25-I14]